MKVKNYILTGIVFIVWTLNANGVPKAITDTVVMAFNSGKTTCIAHYFNNPIDLNILGEEGTYERSNAEQIVKKFLYNHTPISFDVLFEGGQSSTDYTVGRLITKNGTYRVNVLFRRKSIVQIRIEYYDDNR